MRKIDPQQFTRFMRAMKHLKKEMNLLQEKDAAGQIAMQGNELKAIYRKHCKLIEQLEENTELYFDTFSRAHSTYREASRQKSRVKAKLNAKARKALTSPSPTQGMKTSQLKE